MKQMIWLCSFLVLIHVLWIAPTQTTPAVALERTSVASRPITVHGKIGSIDPPEKDNDQQDDKHTIIADTSELESSRLPQTGAISSNRLKVIGIFLLVLLLIYMGKRLLAGNHKQVNK